VNADGFVEVDLKTLCAALERDTLRIKELCLFQAMLKWASHECVRRDMEDTPENQRYVLGRALYLIRFPLVPVEDFSINVAQLGLLTETELVRLYLNFTISSNNQ
jgi:BTB/POZ domain-containing protein 1/2